VNDQPPDDAESSDTPSLSKMLLRLQLPFLRENYHELAQTAAEQRWTALEYLQRLVEGEINRREDSGLARRIRLARFPVLKTLDQFDWSWPKKINRPQLQNLFRLQFIRQKSNAILLGNVGLGKTHLDLPRFSGQVILLLDDRICF
jgi:DNA replication protein DnaC